LGFLFHSNEKFIFCGKTLFFFLTQKRPAPNHSQRLDKPLTNPTFLADTNGFWPTQLLFFLLSGALPPAFENEFPARLLFLRECDFRSRCIHRQDFKRNITTRTLGTLVFGRHYRLYLKIQKKQAMLLGAQPWFVLITSYEAGCIQACVTEQHGPQTLTTRYETQITRINTRQEHEMSQKS